VRVGCRSCSGVIHGSLGRAMACHDERHENSIYTSKHARVATDTHPQSLPVLTASMKGASVSATSTVPA
jgi:hypothetical protein